jgi:glutamate dehydrogenase (NADP+)
MIREKDPHEKEFHQAVDRVMLSIAPLLDQHPEYRGQAILERLCEPERTITFRVPWEDDQGQVRVNRGFRIQMNSAVGPYKGGLRFHPSVSQSILKFLAFEQVFKNALTTMPMGAAFGGSDFDPKGKSDQEIMRFCQNFMAELYRHIGAEKDIPEGDIGVGAREIGYLFGMHKRLNNEFTGAITGKGLSWGGSIFRPQATGYGCAYFAAEMLKTRNMDFNGRTCLISGSGNVAQHTAEKLLEFGAKVVTLSDSAGYIYDEEGIGNQKLEHVKFLKNIRRSRIEAYVERYPQAVYTRIDDTLDFHPMWRHWADYAFPCATQNEIREKDAYNLINQNIKMVCEGANMPCSPEAVDIFMKRKILFGPAKVVNAGGVVVSGLEMTQNNMRLAWTGQEVNTRLKTIMGAMHQSCLDVAEQYGTPGSYINGANIAGFVKVADAILDQGLV